ncbi:hypothetical protein [Niveispirillum fermenti]|uniref:hypothetical protein n=1 Tax=Niveispirillum fermenti TaxID=1233113 RepID=UPI003A86CEE6
MRVTVTTSGSEQTASVTPGKPRFTFDELGAGMRPDNQPEEQFDDRPVGTERVEWDGPRPPE